MTYSNKYAIYSCMAVIGKRNRKHSNRYTEIPYRHVVRIPDRLKVQGDGQRSEKQRSDCYSFPPARYIALIICDLGSWIFEILMTYQGNPVVS